MKMLTIQNWKIMKKFTLCLLFFSIGLAGYSTTWTITDSGFTFSPATLTIQQGDTVIFNILSEHNSVEVTQTTWNANGTTPMPGGWSLPFGGGMVPQANLTVGTHYYVCQPHVFMGMKGRIIVQMSTSVHDSPVLSSISIYPNPSNGRIHLQMDRDQLSNHSGLEIFDAHGVRVYAITNLDGRTEDEIDLSHLNQGLYFIKLYNDKAILTRKLMIQ